MMAKLDLVGKIMDYESGQMDYDETVEFFQELIDTGTISGLQGHYKRVARTLMVAGVCHPRDTMREVSSHGGRVT